MVPSMQLRMFSLPHFFQSKEIEAQIAETKEEGKQVKEALREIMVIILNSAGQGVQHYHAV